MSHSLSKVLSQDLISCFISFSDRLLFRRCHSLYWPSLLSVFPRSIPRASITGVTYNTRTRLEKKRVPRYTGTPLLPPGIAPGCAGRKRTGRCSPVAQPFPGLSDLAIRCAQRLFSIAQLGAGEEDVDVRFAVGQIGRLGWCGEALDCRRSAGRSSVPICTHEQ